MDIETENLITRIWQRAYLDTKEQAAEMINAYIKSRLCTTCGRLVEDPNAGYCSNSCHLIHLRNQNKS